MKSYKIFVFGVLSITIGFFLWLVFKDRNTDRVIIENRDLPNSIISEEGGYKHAFLGFFFEYREDFDITSFGDPSDPSGQTILIQNEDASKGVQILITPFDEDIVLTEERIKNDLPDLVVKNAKEENFGKVKGVRFESVDSSGKPNIEAWFVYATNLYQVTATGESEEILNEVVSSWNWE